MINAAIYAWMRIDDISISLSDINKINANRAAFSLF